MGAEPRARLVGGPGAGFGRLLVSAIEAPIIFVDLLRSGWAAARSGNAAEP